MRETVHSRISDYVLNDPQLYPAMARFFSPEVDVVFDKEGKSLQQRMDAGDDEAFQVFVHELMNQKRGAFLKAPVAKGKFPVVILSHGLGGNMAMWDRAGEFLASHGYIVVAPTFVSDGTAPIVFHDPSSEFSQKKGRKAVEGAYKILEEQTVVPNFFKFLFGIDNITSGIFSSFDPVKATVQTGGSEKLVAMQRNLFRQRISDVNILRNTLEILDENKEECLAQASGSTVTLCGKKPPA